MTRLSKSLESKVHFANWCRREQLEPRDVAELRTLVDRNANLYTAEPIMASAHETWKKLRDRLFRQIEAKATAMGITEMDWPGLYPTFTTPAGNKNVMLPEN